MGEKLHVSREVRRYLESVLTELDSAVSLSQLIRLRHNMWDEIVQCEINPMCYRDSPYGAAQFAKDYQAAELLRKCEGLPTSFDQDAAALHGYLESERSNARTNLRFMQMLDHPTWDGMPAAVVESLHAVQTFCAGVLGKIPRALRFRFGKGSTYESSGWQVRSATLLDKLSNNPSVTAGAMPIFKWAVDGTWFEKTLCCEDPYRTYQLVESRGERFALVNKNSKTRRTISLQPGGNLLLQLAIGQEIRDRLRRALGCDLDHAQGRHQRLAAAASRSGEDVTIDVRSASNSVALNAVRFALLQADLWGDILEALRCPHIELQGKWHKLEMFSAMGNGFTFELETLLFHAIVRSVCPDGDVSVYGDDIICPRRYADTVLSALKFWGFEPNLRKTSINGVFRESCGGDYFDGFCVSPVRFQELPHDPATWIAAHNKVIRMRRDLSTFMGGRSARIALANLPSNMRNLYGPADLGDQVLLGPRGRIRVVERNGIGYIRVWRSVAKMRPARYADTVLAGCGLYNVGSEEPILVRRRVPLAARKRDEDGFVADRGPLEAWIVPRNARLSYRFGYTAHPLSTIPYTTLPVVSDRPIPSFRPWSERERELQNLGATTWRSRVSGVVEG